MQDRVLAFAKDPFNGPQKMGWNQLVASDPHVDGSTQMECVGNLESTIHSRD
jgi:hypothetical protein